MVSRVLSTTGARKLPPNVSAPLPKKSFPKKIKSYFKYWSYLTTILRNQWRLLMSKMRFQLILNTVVSFFFASPKKNFSAWLQKFFWDRLAQPPKQKVPGQVTHTALFPHQHAGFSSEKDKNKITKSWLYLISATDINKYHPPSPRTHTPIFLMQTYTLSVPPRLYLM